MTEQRTASTCDCAARYGRRWHNRTCPAYGTGQEAMQSESVPSNPVVTRLRQLAGDICYYAPNDSTMKFYDEAADEIERLERENAELKQISRDEINESVRIATEAAWDVLRKSMPAVEPTPARPLCWYRFVLDDVKLFWDDWPPPDDVGWRPLYALPPVETKPDLGFGIPLLMEKARERMATGSTTEEAIVWVADYAELRSEAIYALRAALTPTAAEDLLLKAP